MTEGQREQSIVDIGIAELSDARVIGRGGFATVYAATDARFDRAVAVKVLAPMESDADRAQFDRECRVMGRLSRHPSVVTVHHGGFTTSGAPYIAMELSNEGSLADRLDQAGPVGWAEAVSLIVPIADALDHAHQAGVLHRDIKPENILVSDGRPLLSDFGIASIREGTQSASIGVTASWLHTAPETFHNRRDERSDVYSAASTLYHLIAGRAPFERADDESMHPLMLRLVNEPPPYLPPGAAPAELDHYLVSCLAKDPDQRPASAAEFAAGLRSILDGHAPAGPELASVEPSRIEATQSAAAPLASPDPFGAPPSAPAQPPIGVSDGGGGDGLVGSRGPLLAVLAVITAVAVGVSLLVLGGGDDGGDDRFAVAGQASTADAAADTDNDGRVADEEADDDADQGEAGGSDASDDEAADRAAAGPTTSVGPPVGPSVQAPTFAGPAASIDELEDRWAKSRAAVVEALSSEAYGIDGDNVLRGPGGLAVDLDRCPADWSDTIGVDDTTIRIGMTAPGLGVLGDASDIGAGIDRYFRYLNEQGGIDGRRIELVAREDGNDVARTQAAVDDFLGPDGVLAATTIGTPQALAVSDRLTAECLPHPFVMSAHPALADPAGHPFTTPGLLSWSAEAALWGQWIAENMSDRLPVTVAALVVDSEFGTQAYAEPFAAWVAANPGIVSEFIAVRHPSGAPSLVAEMTEVAAAEPDVYISMTAGADCRTAALAMADVDLGPAVRFNPSVCRDAANLLAPAGSAADGILVFSGGLEVATDPSLADDPYIAHVREQLAPTGFVDNSLYGSGFGYYGWLWGQALQIASELPGGLTRSNLVLTTWSLDLIHPMVDDGIGLAAAGPDDPLLLEGSAVLRYDASAGALVPEGTVDVDGATPSCASYLARCG